MSDTIAAISSGNVIAGIGIVRLSGDDAIAIADKVFVPFAGKPMAERADRTLVYGTLLGCDGAVIDHCLCTVSRGPGSYTGENTAEFQCHGSPVVLREGLESLFAAGARQALAGEFTKRAFLNGRMDLTQAEAVIELIHAETVEGAKNAAGQLSGAVSRKTDKIYSDLTDISAHYHAVIDYPDEDIEDFRLEEYLETMKGAERELKKLLDSFSHGRILRDGVPTAIIGRPNAGKSSLLNALLGYDRAIVTSIPGTTRDTIEEKLVLGGILLRLTDTAGLRSTDDEIERIGVQRSRAAADSAELVIALIDGSAGANEEDREILSMAAAAPRSIVCISKADLSSCVEIEGAVRISSLTGEGLGELEDRVKSLFPENTSYVSGEIITSARQAEAVKRALSSVRAAMSAMSAGIMPDAVLTETEAAMEALGELSGKTVREDITARIFERFCVGK
ncbi:MAG: tRNA uridine-5-carboxymethylaminomethyl(34) synthesis GTPase MnmE [Oscillospiraceae bacterium]|nr:tRNA uridine-5-carboxymethylaminomethyl(34) synthesis GTPase MnmE [Oscillospiraceae bacterium]